MFNALKEYFLLPLFRVLWSTIVSIITFNFKELHTNLTMRLPLILAVGLFPFLQKSWLKWYKFCDEVQSLFGIFDPVSTVRRILKNSLCPQEVVKSYFEDITSIESRIKRIKKDMKA